MSGGLGGGWQLPGTGGGGGSVMNFISEKGIAANDSGTQADATELTTLENGISYNRIDIVAVDGGSVKPDAPVIAGMQMVAVNRCGNGNMVLYYPVSGERFLGVDGVLMPVDDPVEIADGNSLTWVCYAGDDGIMTIQ